MLARFSRLSVPRGSEAASIISLRREGHAGPRRRVAPGERPTMAFGFGRRRDSSHFISFPPGAERDQSVSYQRGRLPDD